MYLLFSGCWRSPTTDECENTRCSYDSSQSLMTLNQKVNFCCCHGSKCNELEKGSRDGRRQKADTEKTKSVAKIEKKADPYEEG